MKIERNKKSPFEQNVVFSDGEATVTFDTHMVAGKTWCDWYITNVAITLEDIRSGNVDHRQEAEESLVFMALAEDEPVGATEIVTDEPTGKTTIESMVQFHLIGDDNAVYWLTLATSRENAGQMPNSWKYEGIIAKSQSRCIYGSI
jgi:hypothetical protein